MQLIQPIKDGEAIEVSALPESMRNLIAAQSDLLTTIERQIEAQRKVVDENERRLTAAENVGLNLQGFRARLTRSKNRLASLHDAQTAVQQGYVEVPNMGRGWPLADEKDWGDNLTDAPLPVLQALSRAKEAGVFDTIRVLRPSRGGYRGDPIVYGEAGGRQFYITSWS